MRPPRDGLSVAQVPVKAPGSAHTLSQVQPALGPGCSPLGHCQDGRWPGAAEVCANAEVGGERRAPACALWLHLAGQGWTPVGEWNTQAPAAPRGQASPHQAGLSLLQGPGRAGRGLRGWASVEAPPPQNPTPSPRRVSSPGELCSR